MNFNKITKEILLEIQQIVGKENILTREKNTSKGRDFNFYSHDETEDLKYFPEIVVKPLTSKEVSDVLKIANKYSLPITPSGARTGLSGGALCVFGGIALSMERFNRIIKIDKDNLQVIVEPGVITQVLQQAVEAEGLYYAPDPASRGTCFIGGNLAENSGGPRAVKYGVTKDWVLNLEVVLPTGEIVETGANTLKNSTGYNLTQLMVGSEGTLGIITKATLKLIPKPTQNKLMLVSFPSAKKACQAVSAIFKAGVVPSAMEFMEKDAIDWTANFLNEPNYLTESGVEAKLLIEVDGYENEDLMQASMLIGDVVEQYNASDILFAEDEAQKEKLWYIRRRVGEAVKTNSIYKEEDTVVPRFHLPELLSGVKEIGNEYGFQSVCYGHAGDGNLHINIIKGDMSDDDWNNKLKIAIRKLFELTVKLGGTISGEHGIGLVQKEYMDVKLDPKSIELHRMIKKVFDPNGILNPGKIVE